MLEGYKEADKLDKEFNALLSKHPICRANAREWLKLSRTIGTTCEITTKLCMALLLEKKR